MFEGKSKEDIASNKNAVKSEALIEEKTLLNQLNEFRCEISRKEFKIINNLENNDKMYQILKGSIIYKCDNCDEKMENRNILKQHIKKEHINCSDLQKERNLGVLRQCF